MKPLPTLLIALLASALALPAGADEVPDHTQSDAVVMNDCLDSEEIQAPIECIGAVSNHCQEVPGGGSTVGMVQCLERETDFWDTLLNTRYEELAQALAPAAFEALQEAQRAWIAFRDAECAFEHAVWGDGTIRAVAGASCMLEITAERALGLDAVLTEHQT